MSLTNAYVLEKIGTQFPGIVLQAEEPYGMLTIEVPSTHVHPLIGWMKNEPELQINFLTNIGGIHYPNNKDRELGVVYHLHSLVQGFRIRVKVFIPISAPRIVTVTDLYAGANWMERETFDFYGIIFEGHPNLKRILNDDSMDYFPMRKEYHLEEETRKDKDDRFFGR